MLVLGMTPASSRGADLIYVSTTYGRIVTYDVSLSTADAVAASGTLFSSGYGNAYGVAFDKAGNLYVANEGSQIFKINSSGQGTLFATDSLNVPWGLAFDSAGNLYAANLFGKSITRYDSAGNLIGGAPFISGLASGPLGLAFDASGNLYVGRGGGANTITRYDSSGNNIGVPPFASGTELVPHSLAFDTAGNIYASNYGYNTITRYDSAGNQIGTNFISSGLYKPQEMAFDSAGNLYVASDYYMSKYNSAGVLQFSWSTGGYSPRGVAFKPSIVPEPSTYILGGIASGLFALIARRRNRHQQRA